MAPFRGSKGEYRLTALRRALLEIQNGRTVSSRIYVQAACVALAAIIGATVAHSSLQNPQPKIAQVTWNLGLTRDPAVSADGRQLVYASAAKGRGDLDIWLETLPGTKRIRLTSDGADDYSPSVAGGLVAFRSDRKEMIFGREANGGIFIVPLTGGNSTFIAPEGYGPQLSPDGRWVAYWTGDPSGDRSELYVIPSRGGQSNRICSHCYAARYPVWSSDGTALLFWGDLQELNGQPGNTDWWVVSLAGGSPAGMPKRVEAFPRLRSAGLQGSLTPEAWHGDWVFFSVRGSTPGLWKVRLDRGSHLATGDLVQLTRGSAFEKSVSLSGNDRLYYSGLKTHTNIWALPLLQRRPKEPVPELLTLDDANNGFPSVSQNGSRLVFTSDRGGNRAIWLRDLASDKERVVTASDSLYDSPKLSPDGSSVAFTIFDQKRQSWALKIVPADGSQPALNFADIGPPMAWSPDGKRLLYSYNDPVPTKPFGAGLLDVATGRKTVFQDASISIFPNSFSPDGKWVAFHTRAGANRKLWIAPLQASGWPAVSQWLSAVNEPSGVDMEGHWSVDGKTLYFLSDRDGHRCIWAQRLMGIGGPANGVPFAICHFHDAARSLSAVGTPGRVGFSVLPDRIVFAATQTSGNIWRIDFPESAFRLPFLHW